MFTDFENMFDKIKSTVKQVQNSQNHEEDYANTPQKYTIANRQLQQIKLLSQGAFGFIWLAQDIRTKEQFALKRVICQTDERVKSAKKQKDVMSILPKSSNLVQYFGGDIINRSSQRVVVTVMELCDGGTLFDLLQKRQNKGFSEQQLIKIMLQIMQGLNDVHSTGYYHRDVKLQNVLLGKDKRYKLCDFGSSTKQSYNFSQISKKDYDSTKQEIQALTTPMYRSPEIVDPYLKYFVNHKADIWMTGCVLYTLSYFIHPFIDSNAIGIAAGTYRFPKYPEQTQYRVSDKIKDLIRHMLTPNPSFRPSAKQLIQLLKDWDSFTQVPLNADATRRKKQEILRQQQLQQLNKKCVQFDGDIPIQRLMELQKKVKKKQIQQKPSSFINKKGLQKIKDQNAYQTKVLIGQPQRDHVSQPQTKGNSIQTKNNNQSLFNSKDPFSSVPGKPVVKKQTNINDIWGGFGNNASKNSTNSIDQKNTQKDSLSFFDSFGGSVAKTSNSNNGVNFEEMFAQTPSNVSNSNQQTFNTVQIVQNQNIVNSKPKQETNLLDF